MKHQDFAAALLAAAVAVLTSADALAAPPPLLCRSGDGRRGYDQGYQLQERSLRANFMRYFSCGSVESFLQAVRIEFPESASSDSYLQCRDIGIMQGQNETINAIAEECGNKCTDSGGSIGTNAARQYCRIQEVVMINPQVVELVVMKASLPTCNIATEQACRSAFIGFVNRNAKCKEQAHSDIFYDEAYNDACKLLLGEGPHGGASSP